jgi:4-hydroxy-L-threonine phosphate dehydrogenase PdxA
MIGISMGDACGVGPEIILKAWLNQEIYQNEFVIGDLQVLSYCSLEASGQFPKIK